MATQLLINEKSGTVLSSGVEICREFVRANVPDEFVEILVGQTPALIAAAQRSAADPQIHRVLLIAGDGTAAAIAGILAGTDTVFVPLPGGTMNMLSRDLGFSADLETAIREIGRARPERIDVAFVNGRAFLNNVVFGAFTSAAESREAIRDAETLAETASATAGFLGAVAAAEPQDYTIVVDGRSEQVNTNTLIVANNLYAGSEGFRPIRQALDSGQLGVYIPQSQGVVDFLSVIFKAVAGDLSSADDIRIEKCASCSVGSQAETIGMTVDGEVTEVKSPAEFSIRPKALNVLSLRGAASE